MPQRQVYPNLPSKAEVPLKQKHWTVSTHSDIGSIQYSLMAYIAVVAVVTALSLPSHFPSDLATLLLNKDPPSSCSLSCVCSCHKMGTREY